MKCVNCGLPLKKNETVNGQSPVCEICIRYDKKWLNYNYDSAYKEFEKIIDFYKAKGNKYDCIVPVSGGKDSTYVLHYLKKKMNLNTLAVNYDNGFQSTEAYFNLKKIIDQTGSAYISYKLPWNILKKLYKSYTIKSGGDICGTCNMGVSHAVYKIAANEGVPLIIWGYSPVHENTPIYEGKRYCREKMYRSVIKDTVAEPFIDYLAYDHYKRENHLLSIYLFNYIPYNEEEIKNTLKADYSWMEAKHGSNKADCEIFNLANYYKIRNNGYGRINIKYSALLRDQQISKPDAITAINKLEKASLPSDANKFLGKIELTTEDLEKAKGKRLDYVDQVNTPEKFLQLISSKDPVNKKVETLIGILKPEVERDGGTVELVKIENNLLYFKLGGDCKGCFLQQVMTNYIDTLLLRYIPELNGSFPVYELE